MRQKSWWNAARLQPARRALAVSTAGRRRALAAVAGFGLLAACTAVPFPPAPTTTTTTAVPTGAAFYVPPAVLPAGAPGTIIRAQAGHWYTDWFKTAQVAGTVSNLMYLSTNADGTPIADTATLIVPTTPVFGSRPLVDYAPGTQGWANSCAPSQEMAAGIFDEGFAVTNLLALGYAVVVDDYPGLGTTNSHEYNVGTAEGYSVLDAIRAAESLPGSGLSPASPSAVEGYSQGGGAADWAAQEQPAYAPTLHLVGVAAGGTPANLQAVAANINGTSFFAFLAGTALGFNFAYPSLDLNASLTPAGQTALAALNGMCQTDALTAYAGKSIEGYTIGGTDPISTPQWTAVLNANNLGATKPAVPIYQYHGLVDEVIPYSVEQTLHSQYCALGATTDLVGYPGEHVTTQSEAQTDVDTWIQQRIQGQPATSNC